MAQAKSHRGGLRAASAHPAARSTGLGRARRPRRAGEGQDPPVRTRPPEAWAFSRAWRPRRAGASPRPTTAHPASGSTGLQPSATATPSGADPNVGAPRRSTSPAPKKLPLPHRTAKVTTNPTPPRSHNVGIFPPTSLETPWPHPHIQCQALLSAWHLKYRNLEAL